jgi:hypothetical protein
LEFRGLAPEAKIFSIAVSTDSVAFVSDAYLQQSAANHHALISNNSWHYANDTEYDLGAASYDAAVRDSLPGVSGSQPVLFVFSAGNSGQGALMEPTVSRHNSVTRDSQKRHLRLALSNKPGLLPIKPGVALTTLRTSFAKPILLAGPY